MWSIDYEIDFLKSYDYIKLFYNIDGKYFAYIPKGKSANGSVINSRNTLIGNYTENWLKNFLQPIAEKFGLYSVNNVICEEIGLTKSSSADLVFSTTNNQIQKPENIKIIFEIKMSLINNYTYDNGKISFIGDYTTHKGNPSLLRSDSMLKAIGKSANIRTFELSNKIPILIFGNSPITNSYISKVDNLKEIGLIQGFCSVYPIKNGINKSLKNGFITFNEKKDIENYLERIITLDSEYISSWINNSQLNNLILKASKSFNPGKTFLELLRGENNG